MAKKKTIEQFIKEARAKHGDKYDYSKSVYEGKDIPIIITCRKHGEFKQTPNNHIRGQGCPKCKYEKLSLDQRCSKEEFIEKARKIHGDKYEYVGEYVNNDIPIDILCPIHGIFQQTPHSHLAKHGCPKCAPNARLNTEEFIKRSTEVHNGKYSYINTEFKDTHSTVKIICSIHGEFEQVAYYHLQGAGCPNCNESKLEKEIRLLLEENNIEYKYQCDKSIFPWLDKQSLDIYIPKYNVAIECQGIQHYIQKDIFDSLEKNIKRDKLKYDKCNSNGVKLLYYSDKEFEQYHTLGNFYCDKNELLNELKRYGT